MRDDIVAQEAGLRRRRERPLHALARPLDRRIWLYGGGRLELGNGVVFGVGSAPIELHVTEGAVLTVGDHVRIDGGVSIEVAHAISLGARAHVGTFAKIMDNHFHLPAGCRHERPQSTQVVIEPDVYIGARAIVLPGAHVGAGSHVAPDTVITRWVPPGSFVSGIPAVVRPLVPALRAAPAEEGSVTVVHRLTVDMNDRVFSLAEPRWMQKARARIRALATFRRCRTGEHVHAYGPVHVTADGDVSLGDRAFFLGGMIPTWLTCHEGGGLSIGEDSGFNYGVSIEVEERVSIGRRCMIASMVTIRDLAGMHSAPVVVGDDVWIAHGATLLPGAVVGDGSVVSAGSVVAGTIPPRSLAIGRPARAVPLSLLARAGPRKLDPGGRC